MPLAPSSRLGPYEIMALVGAGGMGEVYRARDTRLERIVALKVLPEHLSSDRQQRERLEREARAVAALQHPNICQLHDIGQHEGLIFLVMEFVEGETLAARLKKDALPTEQALRYGIQIADAVAYAHQREILHRDLKSLNVMITPEGRAKVLDFGLAAPLGSSTVEAATRSQESLEASGTIAGTLAYMAPEVLRGDPPDARSDLWSLGVMLYEMAGGTAPFRGKTGFALTSAILQESPAPLPAHTPPSLRSVILRCMAKEPGERYQQAAEIRAALETIRDATSAPTVAHEPTPAARPGRRRILVAGLAVVIALLAGVALWRLWPAHGPPQLSGQHLVSSFSGSHRAATFSPDGSMIAFISDAAGGVPQVWVQNLAQGDPIEVTFGDAPASRPRWSARNDRIVFARRGQGIWSAPPLGGVPRRILDQGQNPDLSRDGERLVFERDDEIWIAKADGSEARRLEGAPLRTYAVDRLPAFSPDGRQIVFFQAVTGPTGDFWVVPANGGTPRQLTFDLILGGSPVWTPDGRWIIFSSARTGSVTLWRVPAEGGKPEQLTTGAGEDSEPAISADGKKLIFTNVRNNWGLVLLDPVTGQQKELLQRREAVVWPMFSPSGDTIAFFHAMGGHAHLFTVGVDGKDLRQITHTRGERNIMPRWSPDGEFLYFYQMLPTVSFRKVPATGGGSSKVADWPWETHMGAQVSPDGRLLAYTLQGPGRPRSCVVRDMETGQERRLARGLKFPRWSRDSRTVLGFDDSDMIFECPVTGAECRPIRKGFQAAWSGDNSRVFFFRPGPSRDSPELWAAARDGRNEKKIAVMQSMRVIDVHFDVSAKDQIVWAPYHAGRRELWLAELR